MTPLPPNADTEIPRDWPAVLRAVADWLDLTDPIVRGYLNQYGPDFDAERLPEALACLDGDEMQQDLRRLAEVMEASQTTSSGADT